MKDEIIRRELLATLQRVKKDDYASPQDIGYLRGEREYLQLEVSSSRHQPGTLENITRTLKTLDRILVGMQTNKMTSNFTPVVHVSSATTTTKKFGLGTPPIFPKRGLKNPTAKVRSKKKVSFAPLNTEDVDGKALPDTKRKESAIDDVPNPGGEVISSGETIIMRRRPITKRLLTNLEQFMNDKVLDKNDVRYLMRERDYLQKELKLGSRDQSILFCIAQTLTVLNSTLRRNEIYKFVSELEDPTDDRSRDSFLATPYTEDGADSHEGEEAAFSKTAAPPFSTDIPAERRDTNDSVDTFGVMKEPGHNFGRNNRGAIRFEKAKGELPLYEANTIVDGSRESSEFAPRNTARKYVATTDDAGTSRYSDDSFVGSRSGPPSGRLGKGGPSVPVDTDMFRYSDDSLMGTGSRSASKAGAAMDDTDTFGSGSYGDTFNSTSGENEGNSEENEDETGNGVVFPRSVKKSLFSIFGYPKLEEDALRVSTTKEESERAAKRIMDVLDVSPPPARAKEKPQLLLSMPREHTTDDKGCLRVHGFRAPLRYLPSRAARLKERKWVRRGDTTTELPIHSPEKPDGDGETDVHQGPSSILMS